MTDSQEVCPADDGVKRRAGVGAGESRHAESRF